VENEMGKLKYPAIEGDMIARSRVSVKSLQSDTRSNIPYANSFISTARSSNIGEGLKAYLEICK
jgi:hypothetical protein